MSKESPPKPIEHDPTIERPLIVGPDSPILPYPIYLQGWVERGFGRGSKELGCPTANLPDSSIAPYNDTLATGVHYGYAKVLSSNQSESHSGTSTTSLPMSEEHNQVWPMVMSIGWNPFYKNKTRTAEIHVLHAFPHDFYGKELRVIILGFIRPEYNYAGLEALIKDINTDKEVSLTSVARPNYLTFMKDPFFTQPSILEPPKNDPNAPKSKGEGEEKI